MKQKKKAVGTTKLFIGDKFIDIIDGWVVFNINNSYMSSLECFIEIRKNEIKMWTFPESSYKNFYE